jgi:hypothetical protein
MRICAPGGVANSTTLKRSEDSSLLHSVLASIFSLVNGGLIAGGSQAVARLFISHASANNAVAIALRDWLAEQGFDDVFLDIDPNRGLAAGERWQEALKAAADHCEAVLFLISPAWLASKWCLAEFLLANQLYKRIFGLTIEPVPPDQLPTQMTAEWQLCELVGEGRVRSFELKVFDESC